MNNAVFRTTHEPRNNHIRLSKSRGNDKYPMISGIYICYSTIATNEYISTEKDTHRIIKQTNG